MKHVKVTLTYEGDDDDYNTYLKLTQTVSSTGARQIVTVRKPS